MTALLAPSAIPSPPESVWYLGPLPVRAYALAILAGIAVGLWITDRRYRARGGPQGAVLDVAFWAVPFGIVGGRIYHVVSSPDAYFGPDGNLWDALRVWNGGLGIWGAIAFGAVGAWIGLRRAGLRFAPFADAIAPALLVAQAIGRLGNWFNQELFGGPTSLPWGLRIDAEHLPAGLDPGTLVHPTFLYEMLWNLGAAALLVWIDRRFRLGHGRVFWLYVMLYTSGRFWIELLRVDEAELVLGLRLNVWTSVLVFLLALVAFVVITARSPGRDTTLWLPGREPADAVVGPDADDDAEGAGASGTTPAAGDDARTTADAAGPAAGEAEPRARRDPGT